MKSNEIRTHSGPAFRTILIQILRALHRQPRLAPHLSASVAGFLYHSLVLHLRGVFKDTGAALALLEHLGDVVAAEPISRLARKKFPGRKIVWVTAPTYVEIAERFTSVDQIIKVRCMTEWLLLWSSGVFSSVWDLHISNRPCAKCGVAFQKPGTRGEITAGTYLDFGNLLTVNCLSAGIEPIEGQPSLSIDEMSRGRVESLNLPRRFVAIHGRSNEDCKNWVYEKWVSLVSWITNTLNWDVIEVGSVPYAVPENRPRMRSLGGAISIIETAEVIRRAHLFIGIDSGPAHLANAVGTQGIILLGSYKNFKRYTPFSGPYADGLTADLIRADDGTAAFIPVDDVMKAVRTRLAINTNLPDDPCALDERAQGQTHKPASDSNLMLELDDRADN